MIQRIKKRTHEILEGTRSHDRVSQAVQWFIIVLIVLNVTAVVLATVEEWRRGYEQFYRLFEFFSVAVFTVEYMLRVWSCTEYEGYNHPVKGRLRFMATPGAVVDLIAILPFFVPRLTSVDLRAVRALRLFRLFRLLKLGRFSQSIDVFADVLSNKKEQMLIAAMAVTILLVFASSAMYFAEKRVQPEHFSSIPTAMWWGVATLTTVGYGDVYPITTAGRVLGGVIAFLGIGIFALPAGILASGFEEALEQNFESGDEEEDERGDDKEQEEQARDGREAQEKYCPCCGRLLDEEEQEHV